MNYKPEIVVAWFAQHGLIAKPEYRFCTDRKWRFDFVLMEMKGDRQVALEVEGGVWTGGRHTRGSGYVKDLEKYNRAACLGWRVLRVVPKELCMQETVDMVREALNA